MSTLIQITEGWTGEIGPFTLKNGTPPVAFNLTGAQVETLLRDENGRVIATTGTTRIDSDPTSGKVYYTPGANDFLANGSRSRSYNVHFKITVAGKDIFFPNGQPDSIVVWPQ